MPRSRWIYIRHAEGIIFDNVTFKALKKDYRPAIVMDDAGKVTFKDVRFVEPESEGKKQIFPYKSKVLK